jgi:adenine phosphoribosyltransferase
MSIKSKIRTIENFPKPGIMFRDVSTLFSDPEGIKLIIDSFREQYGTREDIDFVVGIESRGFIVGSLIASAVNKGFIMIRKPGKLPGEVISQNYDLEYGKDSLELHKDAFPSGSGILIVDDLIATGGTAIAAISLVEKLEGTVSELAFIVDLPDLGGSEKITNNGYKVFHLTQFGGA